MMGGGVQVSHRLSVTTLSDDIERVPLLLLPRQGVKPQGARLSGQGEEGMTDSAQQGRNRRGN